MAKSLKAQYPPSEGWLHITMELYNAKALGEEQIKKLVLPKGEDPALSDWGPIEQHGKRLKVVVRSPSRKEINANT